MPKQSAIVLSLSIIGLTVPLVALLWCAWRRSLELGARRQQRRSTPPKTGQPAALSYLPSLWRGVAVSATDIWSGIGAAALLVGSVALSAVPSVLGGRNTAARCTAVEVIEVLGPALVLFGVAGCSPRHIPPALPVAAQEEVPQKENDSFRKRKLDTLLRRVWAITQFMTTALLILLCRVVAAWAQGAQTTEVYETEAFVIVRETQQVRIPVNTTRCVMRPLQNDGATGPQALSLQLSLLGIALLVQSARLSASRTDATASLFTLCFHSIFVVGFWISTRDFDYVVRGIKNFIVGWAGLSFQFGLPLYRLYRSSLLEQGLLLVRLRRENEQGTERVEQVEKARGFDRELMMAMTFHEVRNPLNGTVGHLRLAKQLVVGMRRGDTGGGGATAASGGAGGGVCGEGGVGGIPQGGAAGSGALGALEEEVDLSIVATELAVQYLGTLATLHGALTGSRELALAPTELTGLVRSAAAVVRPQLQPGVELRVEVPDAKTHVMTDQMMLMQVLLNLMQNAARFTKQGFVCVRCSVEPAAGGGLSARFAVLDSGSGMSDATKATLFDLYKSVGGIGLGMFLSSKLLSLLGSKIEVESPWRSDGPGAAFYFSVDMAVVPDAVDSMGAVQEVQITVEPVSLVENPATTAMRVGAGQAAAAADAAAPCEPFESGLRVLIADDGQTNRRLLRRAFTGFFGQDWLVTEATTAEEALALAIDTEYALIVMDEIFAPGLEAMRGSAAIIELRAHEAQAGARRRAVIVSCTGNAPSSLVDLKNSGADLVWGKPMPNFTNNEMQNQLAPHLAASRTSSRPTRAT